MITQSKPRSLAAARAELAVAQTDQASQPDSQAGRARYELVAAAVILGEAGLIVFDEPDPTPDGSETALGDVPPSEPERDDAPYVVDSERHLPASSSGPEPITAPTVLVAGHQAFAKMGHQLWAVSQLPGLFTRLAGTYGTTTTVTGLRLGLDQFAARAALDQGLQVHAHLTPGMADHWTFPDRRRWQSIVDAAARTSALAADQTDAIRAMLAPVQAVVVVWDGRLEGNTFEVVRQAMAANMPIVRLNPANRTVESRGAWVTGG